MVSLAYLLGTIVALFAALAPSALHDVPRPSFSLSSPMVRIFFGGDMLFDRSIRAAMEEKRGDYIFSCIDSLLKKADLVVANLEGPITEHASVSANSEIGEPDNFRFTFPTSTAELLFRHNIRVVNLGNNHILNFGTQGARETVASLERAGVRYFGLPAVATMEDSYLLERSVAHMDVGGITFAFINYNEFEPIQHTNKLEYVGMSLGTIREIQAARTAGEIPIVYTHWGVEYATTSSAYSRELAHSFIDAGAEMVIGSHPHVIQEHETYRGKYIYYSLGNFIFDQYWNGAVRTGLLLDMLFGPSGALNIREIDLDLRRDGRTSARNGACG